jgi:endonuclease/exonuclease/phosphatase family metal-dependent hydrolase
MIQIDGLSKAELERALNKGRMPFTNKLLKQQGYKLYPYYPGLPSSTPSVQGELFYGVKQIIPSFSFFDQEEKKVCRMYDGDAARKIEKILHEKGVTLLKDGSSYSNIFSGGALESHFCAVSLGWNKIWKLVHPLSWIIFIPFQIFGFIRTSIFMIWELVVGVIDFLKGIGKGENIWKEIKFIPTRIAICVLLRDLIVLGAKMDIARGLPIIHMNFLGYDEQAHRRGPSSLFAHWTLKGIDNAIAKIYRTAFLNQPRHYDVWIYSDHGQEETVSYMQEYKISVQKAITDLVSLMYLKLNYFNDNDVTGIQLKRACYLGSGFFQKLLFPSNSHIYEENKNRELVVTALGSLAHIYLPSSVILNEKDVFAKQLVSSLHIPMVLTKAQLGKIKIWNQEGEFSLPDQANEIFGENYPYLDEITKDLVTLCHHPYAGDFVISGWKLNGRSYSFSVENGAHAGPGREETNAFVLAPTDVISLPQGRQYLYTRDLRCAALKFLNRIKLENIKQDNSTFRLKEKLPGTIRIMTYNVHSCIGMDGRISPERIARVIARHEPDIVALQEVDINCLRTQGIDQPHKIARHLEMFYHFHPTIRVAEELYGNAILSRYPLQLIKATQLPNMLQGGAYQESRGALWVNIQTPHTNLHIINTHLSLRRGERLLQAQALIGKDWLGHPECQGPLILCGDFNALPNSRVCSTFDAVLKNALDEKADYRNSATWMSHYPMGKIDHIFVRSDIEVKRVKVSRTDLDKISSDHLPLIVDIQLPTNLQASFTQ